ncbi:glycosyltransferase [Priestia aryabhattai]|uniref:glycosyltransferase n=1 Tax=Priestia aryabhattai TaxID=412384 RepID=UPI002E1EC305|nr:glycosyltransferase [Priestia aryabhattai]MED3897046.1 glycosyltransferase [Priestia aryabhattai]
MNILHYTLGLPPYRSGGLTKYSLDLMLEQVRSGHQIHLLYPGQLTPSNKVTVKQNKKYKGIDVYEIINPLPVSLLGGVINPDKFMKSLKSGTQVYLKFLKSLNIEVVHIHTLMGLHGEFMQAAKELNIKLIFTTHDYYGICPKVNLIDSKGDICKDFKEGANCISCNENAFSLSMIYIMQSHFYKYFKDSKLVKSLRTFKKNEKIAQISDQKSIELNDNNSILNSAQLQQKFLQLRDNYINMLEMIDLFHFNSQLTKNEYEKYITKPNKVISITHNNIKDNRKIKDYKHSKLQIGFLGPIEEYKGFPLLRKSLLKLLEQGEINWHLSVYGNDREIELTKDKQHISFHGKYKQSDLESIFDQIDVLIVPSVWKETFGFIGLEAMSHGVPTIVTEYIGFKDLVQHKVNGLIVGANVNELAHAIKCVIDNKKETLEKWNNNICRGPFLSILSFHNKEIEELYKSARS